MAKTEYGRYNPDPKRPRYPWQWKIGMFGRVMKSNTLTDNARKRRRMKASPGKWFEL